MLHALCQRRDEVQRALGCNVHYRQASDPTLHVYRFLPDNLSILGYARSKLSKKDLQEKVKPNLKGDKETIEEFLDKLDYEAGPYDKPEGYRKVQSEPQTCCQFHMPSSSGHECLHEILSHRCLMQHAYMHATWWQCLHIGAQDHVRARREAQQ